VQRSSATPLIWNTIESLALHIHYTITSLLFDDLTTKAIQGQEVVEEQESVSMEMWKYILYSTENPSVHMSELTAKKDLIG